MIERYKITVVGTGYVGMSMAVLLADRNDVIALDIDKSKVDSINMRKPTVKDVDIEEYFNDKKLSLSATLDKAEAYLNSSFIVVATLH